MAVYVSVKRTNNTPYVYVVETYYAQNLDGALKRKQRILLSLGRLSELEKKEPNILERLEREYSTKSQLKNSPSQMPAQSSILNISRAS